MQQKALGKIRDKRAMGPLNRALEDENRNVRANVAKAINKIERQ